MLEFVLEIVRDFFQLQLDVWQRIQVSENVSMWDVILVVFVLTTLGSVFVNSFGGLPSQGMNALQETQESNRIRYGLKMREKDENLAKAQKIQRDRVKSQQKTGGN